MSKSIQDMTIEELEIFLNQIPRHSACDRAYAKRLEEILETKKLLQQQAIGA